MTGVPGDTYVSQCDDELVPQPRPGQLLIKVSLDRNLHATASPMESGPACMQCFARGIALQRSTEAEGTVGRVPAAHEE